MTSVSDRATSDRSIDWPTMLGAASVGLGIPPVVASAPVARMIGVGESSTTRLTLAAVGAREIGVAAGLLTFPRRWMLWARVAGDGLDLALLGRSIANRAGRQSDDRTDSGTAARTVATAAVVAAITAIDVYAAAKGERARSDSFAVASTTVGKSPEEVYSYWRDLTKLPLFMAHLDSVQVSDMDRSRSHWQATAPFGRTVEWDAEIVEDVPGKHLAWRSIEDADVHNDGRVEFKEAPGGQGTEVRVALRYEGVGALARAAARYFGEEPRQHLDDDLRRFKQVMETGEVVRSDGALGGKRARREFPQRPARPASAQELTAEGAR